MANTTAEYTVGASATVIVEMDTSTVDLSVLDYEWFDPGEIVEKLKWKDRTFNKYKPTKVLNVRRDTKGKSGRLS